MKNKDAMHVKRDRKSGLSQRCFAAIFRSSLASRSNKLAACVRS